MFKYGQIVYINEHIVNNIYENIDINIEKLLIVRQIDNQRLLSSVLRGIANYSCF
jgi:hypothetical protein